MYDAQTPHLTFFNSKMSVTFGKNSNVFEKQQRKISNIKGTH